MGSVTEVPASATAAPDTVRALTCPNCGGSVSLRAAGLTVTIACEHCAATLDATDPVVKLVSRAAEAMRVPAIPLGSRGTIDGEAWEVVGYQERSDGETEWSEYLLFNPYLGYGWLVDDGRRFSLGRVLDRLPGGRSLNLTHGGETYGRFGSSYDVRTTFVLGEFPWRAAVGETVRETVYVRPGVMLACEENGAERTWTELTMLAPGVPERAFGVAPRAVRNRGTPSPHEPSPFMDRAKEAVIVGGAATLALLAVALFTPGERRAFQGQLSVPPDAATRTVVLGPVELPATARVTVRADAPALDNQWVDLDYSLIDRATQASYDVYATAERYSGSDVDGPWSEGDGRAARSLSAIPPGRYDLVVEASAHRWAGAQPSSPPLIGGFFSDLPQDTAQEPAAVPVTVSVSRGGSFGGNLLVALLLVWVWPLVAMMRHAGFETRRKAPISEN